MSERRAVGGKTLYGARVGILMMKTRFPRVSGDIGNAHTWPFPVLYIYTFVCWFQTGLVPRDFGWPGSVSREWRER